MLKPASTVHEYTLIFSGDPALSLPDDEAERERLLKHARRTGDWQPICTGEPTVFHLVPLKGSEFDWFAGEVNRRNLVGPEMAALALRLAIKRIDNFGGHKVERAKVDGVALAKVETIDAIYSVDPDDPSVGRAIVTELGNHVIERATTKLDPL
jgi:hypothetical protein